MAKKTHKTKHETKHEKKESLPVKIEHIISVLIAIAVIFAVYTAFNVVNSQSDPIVAKANGESIYLSDINIQWNQLPPEYKEGRQKEEIVESAITQTLVLLEAKKLDITATETEVETFVQEILTQTQTPEEDFYARAEELGISKEKIKKLFKDRIISNKLFQKVLAEDLAISSADAQEYYVANKDTFESPASVRASHILLATEEDAQKVLTLLREGGDFAERAKEHSTGPPGPNGGDLGFFTRGKMVKPFEDAAFALTKGEVSSAVQAQFGFHIIKVTDKKPAGVTSFEDALPAITELLGREKAQTAVNDYVESLKENAQIERFWKEEYN